MADAPCTQHPHAPVIGGVCGGCTQYPTDMTSGQTPPSLAHLIAAGARRDQAELAALRAVSRGYCPACGRGDAAPTVADWEQQRQRADQAEELLGIAHDTSNRSEAERAAAVQRAQRAEAAAGRIRGYAQLCIDMGDTGPGVELGRLGRLLLRILDGTEPTPASAATPATEATEPATWTQHNDGTWTMFASRGAFIVAPQSFTPEDRARFAAVWASTATASHEDRPAGARSTCGETSTGMFGRPLGPCLHKPHHPEPFHRDAHGTEWRDYQPADHREPIDTAHRYCTLCGDHCQAGHECAPADLKKRFLEAREGNAILGERVTGWANLAKSHQEWGQRRWNAWRSARARARRLQRAIDAVRRFNQLTADSCRVQAAEHARDNLELIDSILKQTPGTCPSDCDNDCDRACHEAHQVPWKRQHDPETCPGTLAEQAAAAEYGRLLTAPLSPAAADALRRRLASGDVPRRKVSRHRNTSTPTDPETTL